MLRFLHTSDWHLGHSLRDLDRHAEQLAFLNWLATLLEEKKQAGQALHALLISGDIFDGPNPSAQAQTLFYDFVERARHSTTLIITAGNHDSAERLAAPSPLLNRLGVFVVGAWPQDSDLSPLLCPIHGEGEFALVLAMPFLRTSDLGRYSSDEPNWFAEAHARRFASLWQAALGHPQSVDTYIGMAHCFVSGSSTNENTERRVGNQDEVPADIFPAELTYVALGHLHKAQKIGGKEHIRYSGSTIPLGFSEVDYTHQVLEVHCEKGHLLEVISHAVPRTRDFCLVPRKHATWADVELAIQQLPARTADSSSDALRPLVEVRVELPPEGMADLRTRINELFADKYAQLFRIDTISPERTSSAWQQESRDLDHLQPQDVFSQLCQEFAVSEAEALELKASFAELLREQGLA